MVGSDSSTNCRKNFAAVVPTQFASFTTSRAFIHTAVSGDEQQAPHFVQLKVSPERNQLRIRDMMSVEMSVKRGFRGRRRKVQARPRDAHEEHFVLRVRDPNLVERIQHALSEESKSDESETEDSSKDTMHVEHEPLDIRYGTSRTARYLTSGIA